MSAVGRRLCGGKRCSGSRLQRAESSQGRFKSSALLLVFSASKGSMGWGSRAAANTATVGRRDATSPAILPSALVNGGGGWVCN